MKPLAAPVARHGHRRLRLAWVAVLLAPPFPAGAVDGALDVRQSDQHARSDVGTFSTYWRRETLTARQAVDLTPRLSLDVRARALRETTGGDAAGFGQETVRENQQPDASLTYRTQPFTLGLRTSWLEQDVSGSAAVSSQSSRHEDGGWMSFRLPAGTRFSSSVTRTVANETSASGGDSDSRQTTAFARAEQPLGGTWLSRYRFSGLSGDVTRLGSHREQTSHAIELRGTPHFADYGLTTSFRARSQLSDQTLRVETGDETVRYEAPLAAGVTFDDTPEQRDPLEGAVTSVPALFDGDRGQATAVNIGDSAPVVREFGGDYRNIELDFGESVLPVSATLFVSEPVVHPELIQWRVFVSDEPEGRIWEELSSARFSAAYAEFSAVVRGWDFLFAEDVAGRYLKMVDVKFGTTNADLFVTEIEVSTRTPVGRNESTDRTYDHRFDASLGYDLSRTVRVGYVTALRRRDRRDSDRGDLSGASHSISSRWSDGVHAIAGRVDLHRLTSVTRRSTDVLTYNVSATRSPSSTTSTTASFTRSDDRGGGQNRITDTYDFSTRWRPAPRLQLTHRVSYGRRNDHAADIRSRSVAMSHLVRSSPWPSLLVNLDHSDRWVSRSAGSGFERFHNTGLDVVWAPAPRLTASGDVRLEGRRETDWSTRQTVTWSPLPGVRLETHISGSSFYDSRTGVRRWGSNASATWKPRRQLVFEGSVGAQRYEVGGVVNTPIDTFVRAGLSF